MNEDNIKTSLQLAYDFTFIRCPKETLIKVEAFSTEFLKCREIGDKRLNFHSSNVKFKQSS
jgi:hypothetical protein